MEPRRSTPTNTTGLFSVDFHLHRQLELAATAADPRTVTQTFMLLRPTWSDPADRSTLRQAAAARIAKVQGKTSSNDSFTTIRPGWLWTWRRGPVRRSSALRGAGAFTRLLRSCSRSPWSALVLVAMNTFVFSMGELWGHNSNRRLFDQHVNAVTRFLQEEVRAAPPCRRPPGPMPPR